jgi:hypothetical protein
MLRRVTWANTLNTNTIYPTMATVGWVVKLGCNNVQVYGNAKVYDGAQVYAEGAVDYG